MNIRYLRLLSLVCVISLLLLTSCSGSTDIQSTTAATDSDVITDTHTSETERIPETVILHSGDPDNKVWAEAYLKALPDIDFEGASFIITSPDTSLFDPSEISYLSQAISSRNSAVEKKFNVTVACSKTDLPTMLEEAKKSAAAEMFYSHIMCIPLEATASFEAEGLLMNLRSLPLLDMSMPYFNQSSVSALSAGYVTYGIAGEATPASTELPAVFFNKSVADSLDIGDIYSEALDGGFTWDKFHEYSAAAAALEGKVGAVCDSGAVCDYIFASVGEKYVSSGMMQTPAVSIADYSMDTAASHYRTIRNGAADNGITTEAHADAFKSGSILFTIGKVSDTAKYLSENVSLGILPMPKSTVEGSYLSLASGSSPIFTITEGVTDSAMVSLVLSGLCAASYGVITEEYVNYLHASMLPDSRSADVLELITRNAVYDFATAFSVGSEELRAGTVDLVRHIMDTGDFSYFKQNIANADKYLKKNFPAG